MFFLVPYPILQLLGNNPVDGSWVLALVVTGFGFLVWQQFKSIKDDIKEIDGDVKEIKKHIHLQDLDIIKIKTQLNIEE